MMKRRWSNNGGFLRIQEESSSEVTSSSNGLVLPSGINMSPSSLDSHDYGDQDLWLCGNDASVYGNTNNNNNNSNSLGQQQQSVITVAMHGCSSTLPPQTTIIPINNNNTTNNNNNNNNSSMNGNGNGHHYVPGATNLGSLTNGHNNNNNNNLGSLVNGMQQLQQNGHSHNHNHNHSHINSTTPTNTPTTPLHMQQNGALGVGLGGGGIGIGIMGNNVIGGINLNSLHHTNGGNTNGLLGGVAGLGGNINNINNNNNNINNNNNNNNNNMSNMSNLSNLSMGVPMGMGMQHTPRSDSANSISSGNNDTQPYEMSSQIYSNTGRDDFSPSSSLNGYSANEGCDAKKSKKGPAPRLQEELCLVCEDRASGYHYNALTCEGCKGFFRRSVTKNAVYCCKYTRDCEMDMYMRRKCQECRLKKCLAVGMRPECVVPENQCAMKRREKKAQKEKDKVTSSPSLQHGIKSNSGPGLAGAPHGTHDYVKKEILDLMTCEAPQHATIPLLPDDVLAECQARNIPPLTFNQLAVIYKLIWYQDGYEQPSEEDLKRIMSQPDENESQTDVSFRHITEITILTVQLIVEFAKGLPAFTKIPQEDQITLLKACSSEVMMLRMARRYDHISDSIFFANNRSYTRDSYKMAGMADNIEDLLHFCRQMFSMKVDNVEYALLTAIVIFSDRPGLEKAQLVDAIQSYYIDTLRIYILNRHCGDSMSLVFFAKLLSILTELRTLGNQNAEMCFSLKLKNRKLPKFLEEIWDVHAIPPSVQSHLQAQQEEQERLLRAERMRGAVGGAIAAGLDADSASTSSQAALAAAAQQQQQHQQQQHQQLHALPMHTLAPSVGNASAVSTSSDYIGGGGGGGGRAGLGGGGGGATTAATTNTTGGASSSVNSSSNNSSSAASITAAATSSSSTAASSTLVANGNMYGNAHTAMALMGVPLKSEHSTTTA